MYRDNSFFRALVENSMQSMMKSDFRLTALGKRRAIWRNLEHGARRIRIDQTLGTRHCRSAIADGAQPAHQGEHGLRDDIIRPLLVIQHFALGQLANDDESSKWEADVLKRLVVRSMFGIINASRNAV